MGIWGGGLLMYRSQTTIEDCWFVECLAAPLGGGGGAGVFLAEGSGAVLRRNLFLRGDSSQLGGAIELFYHHNALIENNTFVENEANGAGGAILVNLSSATVRRNIFAGNYAGDMGAGFCCINTGTVDPSCNVFWDNVASHDVDMAGCGTIGEDDNIVADPLFCDAASDMFTIDANSPAAPSDPSGCGLRGAFPVGCGAVSVDSQSWGSIKSLYR
jgi:hypothetical protein